jgi:hypothetical protein
MYHVIIKCINYKMKKIKKIWKMYHFAAPHVKFHWKRPDVDYATENILMCFSFTAVIGVQKSISSNTRSQDSVGTLCERVGNCHRLAANPFVSPNFPRTSHAFFVDNVAGNISMFYRSWNILNAVFDDVACAV